MAGRSINLIDIREIIRQLRMEESERKISEALNINRRRLCCRRKRTEIYWNKQKIIPRGV